MKKFMKILKARKVEEQENIDRTVLIFEFNYCEYLSAPRRDLKYIAIKCVYMGAPLLSWNTYI